MTKTNMTKEELIKINGKISDKIDYWITKDEKKRREFAKAFSWYKKQGIYDREQEIITPSWEQIFVEVGKLLVKQNTLKLKEDLINAENNINRLYKELDKLNKN